MAKVSELILSLFDVGAVKFGSFKLKSGIQSPIYFDLRVIISHPKLMQTICEILEEVVGGLKAVDVICGVPYTALPLATIISVRKNIPMVIKRREQKLYGTGKMIEGEYTEGQTKCLILEDVVTTGSSIVETTLALRSHGILVDEAIVVLNRNYPAADENLKKNGISLTSVVKVDQLLDVLLNGDRITLKQKVEVEKFLAEGQTIPEAVQPLKTEQNGDGEEGIESSLSKKLSSPKSQKLFDIIISKQSNLCLSADCETWQELISIGEVVGSKICAMKTHVDALSFQDPNEIALFKRKLAELASEHNFVIIEDRKFADIGSTVMKQLTAAPFSISEWAHFVTVHSIPGPGMLKAFKEKDKGVILIAEMSSVGNLPSILPDYKKKTLEMVEESGNEDIVVGFVSQSRVGSSLGGKGGGGSATCFLQFTPGVSLHSTGDALGQQYVTVRNAILERDADVIIVGRGILQQGREKWVEAAEQYRKEGWEALKEKLQLK
ncbi:unnamed protein product [Orchesella dallaii]|uniref:Uridine 5'-monophosphate synthase n=1 Tax=Orchesella dallaii TaxID=48710 RepID=A0ABP1QHV1_9HEXA